MKHLRLFEAFNVGILKSERLKIEEEWGCSIEDIEDILIDLSDLNRTRGCVIKTGNRPWSEQYCRYVIDNKVTIKYIPELIILSEINVTRTELDNILSTIKRRLIHLGISITRDETLRHGKTDVSKNIYFVCLRLMSNSDVELVNKSKTNQR